jgi:hypothetical protein
MDEQRRAGRPTVTEKRERTVLYLRPSAIQGRTNRDLQEILEGDFTAREIPPADSSGDYEALLMQFNKLQGDYAALKIIQSKTEDNNAALLMRVNSLEARDVSEAYGGPDNDLGLVPAVEHAIFTAIRKKRTRLGTQSSTWDAHIVSLCK